jgi:hypothetical protein
MNFNEEHFPVGFVRLKAKTKKRVGLDGNQNRGLLIVNEQGLERWVSITDASITELPLGSSLYFNGQGARPSLTIPQQQQAYSNQYQSLGDAIQGGYTSPQQQVVDFENNARAFTNQQVMSQPQNNNAQNINESLLESTCYLLSNAVNLMSSLSPNLSEESIVKLAISASITYSQQIKDLPF